MLHSISNVTISQCAAIESDEVLTSLSIPELLPRNENDLSCTDERYQGPVDHQG